MKEYRVSDLEQVYLGNELRKATIFKIAELTPDKLGGKSWHHIGTFSCSGHIKRASTIQKYITSGKINPWEYEERKAEAEEWRNAGFY